MRRRTVPGQRLTEEEKTKIPTTVNEQTTDAINLANVKNLGELHSLTAGLAGQNQMANQQRVNEIATQMMQLAMQQALNVAASQAQLQQAIAGRVARFMLDTSAEEAISFTKQIGADLQDKITQLGSALSAVQESIKTAQTTPPQTGSGGAFGSDAGSALSQQLVNLSAVVADLQAKLLGK